MLVGGFVALIIVATLFLGGNANRTTNSGAGDSNISSSTQPQESIPVGTSTDIRDDRAVQIERSETVDSIPSGNQFIKPVDAKGGKLVVVYMTLTNTGQESGNMFWTKFQLIDNQGRKYDEIEDFEEIVSIDAWLESQGLEKASNQLFPGATPKLPKSFVLLPMHLIYEF
ncbi:MAG: DUF4352 domain-containing protein [Leptolyngbyaceae cyanobacterium SL_5_9]|nr:DUF4352 domain-containing protein [Leptolyngbyaceae cyanobacterium SL_5_9]